LRGVLDGIIRGRGSGRESPLFPERERAPGVARQRRLSGEEQCPE